MGSRFLGTAYQQLDKVRGIEDVGAAQPHFHIRLRPFVQLMHRLGLFVRGAAHNEDDHFLRRAVLVLRLPMRQFRLRDIVKRLLFREDGSKYPGL